MLIELRPSNRQTLTQTVNDTDAFFAINDDITKDSKEENGTSATAKSLPTVYTKQLYSSKVSQRDRLLCDDEEVFPVGSKDWDDKESKWQWKENDGEGFDRADNHIQWGIVDGGHRWVAVKVGIITWLCACIQ